MKTSLGELEFQSGQLVKVGGARYNYMDGNKLLTLVGELGRLLAPFVDKPPVNIVLNSETGGDPVNSHGGLAQAVYWELLVNDELIQSESARHRWSTDPKQRELNTRIDKAPPDIKMLFDRLCEAVGTPNPPVEAYRYENVRQPGEFGEGATVRSYEDQGTAHDPHAGAHEVQGRQAAPVDEKCPVCKATKRPGVRCCPFAPPSGW